MRFKLKDEIIKKGEVSGNVKTAVCNSSLC